MVVLIDTGIFGFWLILFAVSVKYFQMLFRLMILIVYPESIMTSVVVLLVSIGYVEFCLPNWNA